MFFFPRGLCGEIGSERVVSLLGSDFFLFFFISFSFSEKACPYDIINVLSCEEFPYLLGP